MTGGECDETSISTNPTKRHTTGKEERREDKRRREPTLEWIPKKSKRKMRERERENKNLYFPYIHSLYHGKPIFLN